MALPIPRKPIVHDRQTVTHEPDASGGEKLGGEGSNLYSRLQRPLSCRLDDPRSGPPGYPEYAGRSEPGRNAARETPRRVRPKQVRFAMFDPLMGSLIKKRRKRMRKKKHKKMLRRTRHARQRGK